MLVKHGRQELIDISKSTVQTAPDSIHYNEKYLVNEKDMANAMNELFVNVGQNLNKDIKNSTCSYFNSFGPSTHNSIFITDVTSYEIHLLLDKIK